MSPREDVLNQVIDTVLAKVKDFQQWRGACPESYVPRNTPHRGGRSVPNAYVLLWFSTAFWIASLLGSLLTIGVYRAAPTARFPLPAAVSAA